MKTLKPNIKIIGVEPEGSAKTKESLKAGKPITLDEVSTLADGLATRKLGEIPFGIIQQLVDEVVIVNDDDIAKAIVFGVERCNTVLEGAGATALASLLSNKVEVAGRNVAVILSGGNIDRSLLSKILTPPTLGS